MGTQRENPARRQAIFRKLSFLADEVTWHLALAAVLVAALVDDVLSFGTTIP
jgi:hypothetical protein